MLERLLVASHYDVHQQCRHLTLFGLHVIPYLGPATSGPIILNIEIHPKKLDPQVKVYFPVGGLQDEAVANAIRAFFKKHNVGAHASTYKENLKASRVNDQFPASIGLRC
ncbi:hypothetical protein BDV59DRAFT_178266 [Aspergillus ambiguus]|uniref:uncharacterized protein n=1 Tax=Aspergillus ambiguus TaxID=176160 RepID=UPI003CCD57E2